MRLYPQAQATGEIRGDIDFDITLSNDFSGQCVY